MAVASSQFAAERLGVMPGRVSWFALLSLLTGVLLIAGGNALAPGRIQFAQPAYFTTEDFGVAYITGSIAVAAGYLRTCHGFG